MTRVAALIVLLGLAACGVDGPPLPVTSDATGIAITGEAKLGVKGRF